MECRSCHSQRRPRSRRRRSGWCMAPGGGTPPEGPAQCSDPTAGAAACRAERRPPAVGGGWQAQQRHASENDAQQVALTLQTVCQLLLVPSFASHVGHTADSHSAKSAPRPATCTGPLEACWQPIRRPSQTARTAAAAGTSARVGMWVGGRAASGRVGEGTCAGRQAGERMGALHVWLGREFSFEALPDLSHSPGPPPARASRSRPAAGSRPAFCPHLHFKWHTG